MGGEPVLPILLWRGGAPPRGAFRWHRPGAIEIKDLEQVAADTTTQEKASTHPSDARLTHRAIEKLVELAKREDVELRQSYLRLAKRATIMVGRYTHAHQFKRARRQLKFLRRRLGRINKLARTFAA
jgi:transposase, IS5 family